MKLRIRARRGNSVLKRALLGNRVPRLERLSAHPQLPVLVGVRVRIKKVGQPLGLTPLPLKLF